MKILTIIGLITMLCACSATETTACPPKDQWIEPSSGPFQCARPASRDILQPYAIKSLWNVEYPETDYHG